MEELGVKRSRRTIAQYVLTQFTSDYFVCVLQASINFLQTYEPLQML